MKEDGNTASFSSVGDTDYGFSQINQQKEYVMDNLNKWFNVPISYNPKGAYFYLSELKISLTNRKPEFEASIKTIRENKVVKLKSLVRECSKLSQVESSIRDVQKIQARILMHEFIADKPDSSIFSQDGPDSRTAVENLFMSSSVYPSVHSEVFKDTVVIPTNKVFDLAGLCTIRALQLWKTIEAETEAEVLSKEEPTGNLSLFGTLGLFFNIIDKSLVIKENKIKFLMHESLMFKMVGGSFLFSGDLMRFVHVHTHEITSSSLLDLAVRVQLFNKPGILSVETDDSTIIYKMDYTEEARLFFGDVKEMLLSIKEGKIPTKVTPPMASLRALWKSQPKPIEWVDIPKHIDEISFELQPSSTRFQEVSGILNLKSCQQNSYDTYQEVIRVATRNLLRPAFQLLVFVCNAVEGMKAGQHVSDVPVLYVRVGKGMSIKKEVKLLLELTKTELARNGIKVVCVSGDTAQHPILLHRENGDTNNIAGLKIQEFKRLRQLPEYCLNEVRKHSSSSPIISKNSKGAFLVSGYDTSAIPYTTGYKSSTILPVPPTKFPTDVDYGNIVATLLNPKVETLSGMDYFNPNPQPSTTSNKESKKTKKTKIKKNKKGGKKSDVEKDEVNSPASLTAITSLYLVNDKNIIASALNKISFYISDTFKHFTQSSLVPGPLPPPPFEGYKEMPVLGSTKKSAHGEYTEADAIDIKHSLTRDRSNGCKRSILGGYRDHFLEVAHSGLTELKPSDLEDKTDQQSDKLACVLFSEQTEACLRLKALSYIEDPDQHRRYLASAESCRFNIHILIFSKQIIEPCIWYSFYPLF